MTMLGKSPKKKVALAKSPTFSTPFLSAMGGRLMYGSVGTTTSYVAFKNYQPKNTVVAVSVNDGDPLWTNDDENEIFISTTYPGSRPYYQAIMNPLGAKSGLNGNLDWDVAAEIYDEYWVVEVAIPFYIFDNYYPEIGDEWSINLTRRSHAHAGGNGEWRCWSDLVVNTFLDPLTFGLLEFVQ